MNHIARYARLNANARRSALQLSRVRPVARRHEVVSRCLATSAGPSTLSTPVPQPDRPLHLYDESYIEPTQHTISVFRRLFKYTIRGLLAVGLLTYLGYEGAHAWIERVELSPEASPDGGWWGWDMERESWTGENGGTASVLGWKARHALRSAWVALNWGSGMDGATAIGPNAHSGQSSTTGGLNVTDQSYAVALAYLEEAIVIAESRREKLPARVMRDLKARRATVLERVGTVSGLRAALSDWEEVFQSAQREGAAGVAKSVVDAARAAAKVGDIYGRLGAGEDAVNWWTSAIQLSGGGSLGSVASQGELNDKKLTDQLLRVESRQGLLSFLAESTRTPPPTSALAQRTIASALISLSAYYSTTNQLPKALTIQLSALAFLAPLIPTTTEPLSPPRSLHDLFLQHRLALVTLHMAEVIYALSKVQKTTLPLALLASSSIQTEQVAQNLAGLPLTHPDVPQATVQHPPSPTHPIQAGFQNRTLRKPATRLVTDARRMAIESWNSRGLLLQEMQGKATDVMECFERALQWAGGEGGIEEGAGENTLELEWRKVWSNYVRARERVLRSQ